MFGKHSKKMARAPQFGEIAKQKGWLTEQQLTEALHFQQREKTPLGAVCKGLGFLRHLQVRDILAEQWGLRTVDLLKTPPYPGMLSEEDRRHYEKLQCVPWREEKGITWLATVAPSEALHQWAKERYGESYQCILTSPLDIQRTLAKQFADEDSNDACLRLARQQPGHSAHQTLTRTQAFWMLFILAVILFWVGLQPIHAMMVVLLLMNVFFAATLAFKCYLFLLGRHQPPYDTANNLLLNDEQLPAYTVLIPLYKEKAALPQLLQSIRKLDYPKSKLDVKLIIESDDAETFAALRQLRPESYFDIIRVPVSFPRTKPKACNYALRFAQGEMVCILDAEDQPDPLQLRKAASFFVQHDGRTICLQARLNYYNRDKNLLTKLFSIEYGAWFDYMLRGLNHLHMPIPLGGTSNHFPRHVLERFHAWDAYNVTEDADLGYRMAINGGHCGLMDSITLEEAPVKMMDWLRQRTRWIKGYMQTYLVHMRHPWHLWQQLGLRGFFSFQLFVGGPVLVYLSAPFLWAVWLAWVAGWFSIENHTLYYPLLSLIYLNLFGGLFFHLWQGWYVIHANGWQKMQDAWLTYPFYWIMHSLAGFRAFWQLIHQPHYWDKTPHGQSLWPTQVDAS